MPKQPATVAQDTSLVVFTTMIWSWLKNISTKLIMLETKGEKVTYNLTIGYISNIPPLNRMPLVLYAGWPEIFSSASLSVLSRM